MGMVPIKEQIVIKRVYILNPNSPFRADSNRDNIFKLISAMNGASYQDVTDAVSAICKARKYSNTMPQRHIDRLVDSGHVQVR
jgi:hypothetical protein